MPSETIVITGANGLVGSHLRLALTARGAEIRALSLRAGTIAPGVIDGADAVIHLAGESVAGRWSDAKRAAILQSRQDGTRRVVDAIEAAAVRPRVLIAASAIGYYGDRADEVLTEESARGTGFLADVCEAWEAQAVRAESLGVRVVRLRFGVVEARDAMAFTRLVLPAKLGLGGPLGSGRQWWSWIHIDDLVALVTTALDDDRYAGAFNATSPGPARQRDIAKALGRVLHRPAVLPAPAFALRAILGGFSEELLGSRRVIPARAQGLGFTFRFAEIEAALADLTAKQ
jgi:uncharacterized protein (TIGR01777 family)